MRTTVILCLALILAGCAGSHNSDNEFVYDERDAIPNDIPLPKPGINQHPIVGVKKVLVSVVNWQGETILDTPLTFKDTLSTDPNSLRTYILAASHGKLTLKGQVISHTSGPRPEECKSGGASYPMALSSAEGEKAARAHGLDPKDFDFLINVISCRGGASAQRPGRYMGVYGQGSPHLFKHEFGHNLGYAHGYTYTGCHTASNVVSAPGSCQTIELGDTGDPVSGGGTLYPASNRWYSGWLDNSQAAVVEKRGLYRLAKLGNAGPQVFFINRPGLNPPQVALEYRKPTPFDNFPLSDNRVNGVWIRYTSMGGSLLNTQLDGTPSTAKTDDPTFLSEQAFWDLQASIKVDVCSATENGALIYIDVKNEGLPNLCKIAVLLLPEITNPVSGTPQTSPMIFSGRAIPGADIDINYRLNGQTDWTPLSVPPTGADGKWQAQPLSLTAGNYTLSVRQRIELKSSGYNIRTFNVSP